MNIYWRIYTSNLKEYFPSPPSFRFIGKLESVVKNDSGDIGHLSTQPRDTCLSSFKDQIGFKISLKGAQRRDTRLEVLFHVITESLNFSREPDYIYKK